MMPLEYNYQIVSLMDAQQIGKEEEFMFLIHKYLSLDATSLIVMLD
jgi:hypothetical protein